MISSEQSKIDDPQQRLPLTQFSVDHAADAIFWIDRDFKLIYVNGQAVRSLGYSRDELLSMHIWDLDPAFPILRCEEVFSSLQQERYLEFESIHRRRDGNEFPVWVTSSYYCEGDIELVFACCRDISAQKAAEAALLRANEELELRVLERTAELATSEARYQDLYHHAPDMFASVDAISGRLVQCNQTLARSVGSRMETLIGRPLVELFSADSQADVAQVWSEFLETGEAKTRWLSLCCRGEERIVSLSMTAVRGENGEILLARSAFRDITEIRRAAEEADRHRTELAHVARLATTGEMAAGLAHELNQPLYAVNNFAQGAIRRLESGTLDRELLIGVLRDIAQESQRAAEIIRSLRRYVGQRETQRMQVDLNQSVRRVVGLLRAESVHRETPIELDLAEPLAVVSCDAIQIEQVLMNLVLNAMEASADLEPGERSVSVSSRVVNQRLVQLAVADRGMGIGPADSERIFDAFFTTKSEGLGLGLTISKRIVEAHGGRLVVSRNRTRGVTASFSLPAVSWNETGGDGAAAKGDYGIEVGKLTTPTD